MSQPLWTISAKCINGTNKEPITLNAAFSAIPGSYMDGATSLWAGNKPFALAE